MVTELCCEIFHFVVDCEYSDNELNEPIDLYVNLLLWCKNAQFGFFMIKKSDNIIKNCN